jgi:hypothetical protein
MPKFSVNDRISFINEKQDGIIQSVLREGIYIVEIEEGFTIEATENELVLSQQNAVFNIKQNFPENKKEEPGFIYSLINNLPGLQNGVFLISCPNDQNRITTGPVDVYLVNKTDYIIHAGCSLNNNGSVNGISSFQVGPFNELRVTTLERNEKKPGIYIQLIFFKEGAFKIIPAVAKSMEIEYPELAFAQHELPSPYAFCRTNAVHVLELNYADSEVDINQRLADELKQSLTSSKHTGKSVVVKNTSSQYEVDLHIEELLENFSGLSKADIIEIQLNYFRKKLDEAILKRLWKIIFIHGSGNGKLKSAIRKELADLKMQFTDAPYEQYGGGATEVKLG